MNIQIRAMLPEDIVALHEEFLHQGWNKPIALFEQYYIEQKENNRKVYVAVSGKQQLGYATLLKQDISGPFCRKKIPVVYDFNVLEKYQRHGIGSLILDEIEMSVRHVSDYICLSVGLHAGYGAAQRLYVKRGYIPDGSGVWYNDKPLGQNEICRNDDELVLYLWKKLN